MLLKAYLSRKTAVENKIFQENQHIKSILGQIYWFHTEK
jgi:hypothetical protein